MASTAIERKRARGPQRKAAAKAGTRTNGRTPSVRPARGRDELLRAAASEFAAKGYEGATTASIAQVAGVTQPLVHHHFESKELLWRAVLDQLFSELRRMQERVMREYAGKDLVEQLKALLHEYTVFNAEHPELTRMIVIEGSRPGPIFDHIVRTYVATHNEWALGLIKESQRQGFMKAVDPRLALYLVLGASSHPFLVTETALRLYGLDICAADAAKDYADLVVDALFNGLRLSGKSKPPTRPASSAKKKRGG